LQTGLPVSHSIVATRHGFVAGQVAPSAQSTHVPALQTPVEQVDPTGRFPVPALQVGGLVEQSRVPALHSLFESLGLHLPPCSPATHEPAPSHTCFEPQVVPVASGDPSVHVGVLPSHAVMLAA